MIVNERTTEKGLLVSVCDPDTLGETYESDDISLTVTEDFYDGEELDESDVIEALSRATIANIVGADSVALAIEHGFVEEANVLEVGSTVHAQMLRLA